MMKNNISSRFPHRLQIAALALILALLSGALVACAPSAPVGQSTQTTPAGQTSSSPESKYGGSVVLGITQEPAVFDPHKATAAGDKEILFNIYEGLMKCTSSGEFVPALATDYEISLDAISYTFTVRSGVLFHDGTTMTLDDVVYSLSRAAGLNTGKPLVTALSNIKTIEKSGDDKIMITLSAPDSELIPFFTTAILPQKATNIDQQPIGTGPFQFISYTVGQSVVLEKNPQYWQKDLPYLDKVTFKVTADMDAAFLELKSGAIDIFPYLTNDKATQLTDTYNILSGDTNMVQIFALNNAVAPFDNVLVRQAMNYAVNKEDLMAQVVDGLGTPLVTGMSPAMGVYYNKELDSDFTYDPEKAKALLSQAGYPNGFDTTVTVPASYLIHVNTAVVLAEQLKQVGINLEIKSVDWQTWLSEVYSGRHFDSTIIALTSEFAPRDVMSRYVSTAENNFINFNSTDFDKIFSQISTETNQDKRISMYHELQKLLVQDAASVYLQDPSNIVAVKKGLSGYNIFPIYVQDMSTVYFG